MFNLFTDTLDLDDFSGTKKKKKKKKKPFEMDGLEESLQVMITRGISGVCLATCFYYNLLT